MKERIRRFSTFGLVWILLAVVFTGIPFNVSAETESLSFAGGSGTAADPYEISDVNELQDMKNDLSAHYILVDDIDCSGTSSWNGGAGFEPIGKSYLSRFTGSLDGNGYKITDLYINRPSDNYIGLFGFISGCEIKYVGLENAEIYGKSYVGGLVGNIYVGSTISTCHATGTVSGSSYVGGLVGYSYVGSTISTCHATGTVSGSWYVGGLIGLIYRSTVTNCYSTGSVSGSSNVGGLIGYLYQTTVSNSYSTGSVSGSSDVGGFIGDIESSIIFKCFATGSVNGDYNVGGLIGKDFNSIIRNSYASGTVSGYMRVGGLSGNSYISIISWSYATGSVSGSKYVGGLIGFLDYSTIEFSYAKGSVSGSGNNIGGLVGYSESYSLISNSYSTGCVSGSSDVGGLVGFLYSNGKISYCYSTGSVNANYVAGGLVARNYGTVTNSFWDTETSGTTIGVGVGSSSGVTGKTTKEMKKQATFIGWNFDTLWKIIEDWTYPYFQWQKTPEDAAEYLISEIEAMGLEVGIENSMVSKLENALKSLDKEQANAAINQLEALINQVEALRGKKLTEEQADALIEEVQWIIDFFK